MKILTSIGLSVSGLPEILRTINSKRRWKSVVIIVSAHPDGRENKYAKLAKEQFVKMGIDIVDFVDFYKENVSKINSYDLVYIAGGNTFRLLKSVSQQTNGRLRLSELLKKKDVIGVSAGSILLTPTIRIANEVNPDEYVEVDSLNGLGLVPFEVYPHYNEDMSQLVLKYEKKHNTTVVRISDQGYVLLE